MLFTIRFAPDQYETQEKSDETILENGRMLKPVPDSKNV